ncbi:hypothetical protein LT85_1090 [Collimonas arenae]|uniref:Transmembrane protein n=1 Tax=Collimonas arenae TaxID=279058 RepID=A0A0A1F6E8_9BURK|nr:hypothetical protein LT85_1090 [Collimonas arenae]
MFKRTSIAMIFMVIFMTVIVTVIMIALVRFPIAPCPVAITIVVAVAMPTLRNNNLRRYYLYMALMLFPITSFPIAMTIVVALAMPALRNNYPRWCYEYGSWRPDIDIDINGMCSSGKTNTKADNR